MVKGFGIAADEKDIGWYVGMLASSFCLAQLFTSLPWGWISDRIGRRPVILIGLVGNAITCSLFGWSKSFGFAVYFL
jgi:MFS family permease